MNRQRQWLAVAAMALLAVGMAPRAEAVENIANSSGYWTNAAIWSASAVPNSTHDVVIPTGVTVTCTGLTTNFINSLTITGTLEHAANASTETHKLILDIAGGLTIASGGKINVKGRGYGAKSGPGSTPDRSGAAHAGQGGFAFSVYGTGSQVTYGSIKEPSNCGSGTQSQSGGGVVILRVGDACVLDGSIVADGNTGSDNGGAAGGSINIAAGTLSGAGTLSANGGNDSVNGGGGGGGRIAVVLTNGNFNAFPVANITAFGGTTSWGKGAAGTVYLKASGATYGDLIVNNSNRVAIVYTMTMDPTNRFDSITTTNAGVLAIDTNAVLDLTGCALRSDSTTNNLISRLVFGPHTNSVIWPESFTNTATLSQRGTNAVVLPGDMTVVSGGILLHEANGSSEANKLNLAMGGALTLNSGASVYVTGRGYAAKYGPGGTTVRGGAAHGGGGGNGISGLLGCREAYGSITNPVSLGSGTQGQAGGGVVILRVGDACVLDGSIVADGNTGSDNGGAAGGSINIAAGTLSGAGTLSANGGNDTSNGGGGGGGRIALSASGGDTTQFQLLTITAYGGVGNTQERGAAGTVFLKAGNQTYGSVIVANNNYSTTARTMVGTNVTDAVVGDVTLRDNGQFTVYTNLTLTVYGNWSNGVSATALSGGGTVLFAGATTNTVHGNTTFDNVICQTPGKTLKFEGGKTQTMLAGLTIAGVSNNPVALLPATAGQQWFIKVTNSISAPSISYVVVSNSTALTNGNGQALTAQYSTPAYVGVDNSLNGNTNWSFPLAEQDKVWNGSLSTSWGNENNWTPSGVPQSSDLSITIPEAPANQPVLDIAREYSCPLTVQSSARLILGGRNLTVGALTNAGTIIATGSETLTCLNDVDFTDGSFTAAQSTVQLSGTLPQSLTANGATFCALNIANTNAVAVTDAFAARDLNIRLSSADVAFSEGFAVTNLSVVVTNGATLTFTAGKTYNVGNGLVLVGVAGKPILMNNAGGSWLLNVGGYAAVRYVSADYSDARGGRKIYAVNSTDGGHNQNWDFGAGKVWVGTTTSWTDDTNWLPSGAPVSTNFVLIDGSSVSMPRLTNATTIAGLSVVGASGPATLTVDMPSADAALSVNADLGIGDNATLTHTANPAGTAEVYRLVVNVGGNLTVGAGGMIQVTGRGYAAKYGPGRTTVRGGAAHGGGGGNGISGLLGSRQTYGSIANPVSLGSGTQSQSGGGVAILRVGDACVLDGSIVADGNTGSDNGGAAGGSINIAAGTLSGAGTLSANGGNDTSNGGGGGGGRIALSASGGDTTQFQLLTITAYGGVGKTQERGAAGTIYLQSAAQGAGRGTVTINNNAQTTSARTQIPPFTNAVLGELRSASVIVTNRGAMAVTTNDRIASLTVVNTTEPLNLGASNTVLTVMTSEMSINGTAYTKAGLYTTNNWNGFDSPGVNVTGAGAILLYRPSGAVIMFR